MVHCSGKADLHRQFITLEPYKSPLPHRTSGHRGNTLYGGNEIYPPHSQTPKRLKLCRTTNRDGPTTEQRTKRGGSYSLRHKKLCSPSWPERARSCFERCAPCWDDKKRYRRCDPSPPLTLVTAACAAYRFGRSRCPGPAQNGVWSCAGGKSHVTHHRRSAKLEKRNRTHTGRARCRAGGDTAMFCSGFSSSRLFRSVTLSCSSSFFVERETTPR